MSSDPLALVRPGDPLPDQAATYNAMIEAARDHRAGRGTRTGGRPIDDWFAPANLCAVKWTGSSAATLDPFSVLAYGAPAVGGPGAAATRYDFQGRPVFQGSAPAGTDGADQVLVTLGPVTGQTIGRAACAGLVAVQVDFADASHAHAHPQAGTTDRLYSNRDGRGLPVVYKEAGTGLVWAVVLLGANARPAGFHAVLQAKGTNAALTTGWTARRIKLAAGATAWDGSTSSGYTFISVAVDPDRLAAGTVVWAWPSKQLGYYEFVAAEPRGWCGDWYTNESYTGGGFYDADPDAPWGDSGSGQPAATVVYTPTASAFQRVVCETITRIPAGTGPVEVEGAITVKANLGQVASDGVVGVNYYALAVLARLVEVDAGGTIVAGIGEWAPVVSGQRLTMPLDDGVAVREYTWGTGQVMPVGCGGTSGAVMLMGMIGGYKRHLQPSATQDTYVAWCIKYTNCAGWGEIGAYPDQHRVSVVGIGKGPTGLVWEPKPQLATCGAPHLTSCSGSGGASASTDGGGGGGADCRGCDLGDGNVGTLVVPDGPNAGTYTGTWFADGGGNPTIQGGQWIDPLPPDLLGLALYCLASDGRFIASLSGTVDVTSLTCGPPVVAVFPGAAFGATGDVTVTT